MPSEAPLPTLEQQLAVMAEQYAKTGITQMPAPMSRAEHLLRRVLTANQLAVLPLQFGPEPSPAEHAEGKRSVGLMRYAGHAWALLPYIDDLEFDPEEVTAALSLTTPDQPLRVNVRPLVLTDIFQEAPHGMVPVRKDVEPDKLYPRLLELLLPYRNAP